MIRRIATLTLALLLAGSSVSSLSAQVAKPSLSAGRITSEVLLGTYTGIGGFVVGRYVGQRIGDAMGVTSDDTSRRLGFTAGVLAAGLTTAGTVYGIGNIGDQTGDFATTYLGTGVGFVAAWGLQRALLGPQERPRSGMSTAMRWTVANVLASLPAAGATIGFNSTRRFK